MFADGVQFHSSAGPVEFNTAQVYSGKLEGNVLLCTSYKVILKIKIINIRDDKNIIIKRPHMYE